MGSNDDIGMTFPLFLLGIFSALAAFFFHYIRNVISTGIHYVKMERQSLHMSSSYNPFTFVVNYTSASYSGIKCILKSEKLCYIQALWGVPISSLFELLHGDWQSLVEAIGDETDIPEKKFSNKCICANDPFLLPAGEELSIEFRPHLNVSKILSHEGTCMRKIYPFVILMVLKEKDEVAQSFVVAMANAIHVPDNTLLLGSQLIGQYVKLASGHVGQIKKIFLSSPVISDDKEYDSCIVCYQRPVSKVLLPCRHACLCSVCFKLCEKCPVCRSISMHYFELPNVYGDCH